MVARALFSSGSLQAKNRGRKYSVGWSRIDDPHRKGPLGAMKIDGNTDTFQLSRGKEVRSWDKVSGNSFEAQETNSLSL